MSSARTGAIVASARPWKAMIVKARIDPVVIEKWSLSQMDAWSWGVVVRSVTAGYEPWIQRHGHHRFGIPRKAASPGGLTKAIRHSSLRYGIPRRSRSAPADVSNAVDRERGGPDLDSERGSACGRCASRVSSRADASLTLNGPSRSICRLRKRAEQAPQPYQAHVRKRQSDLDSPLNMTVVLGQSSDHQRRSDKGGI